MEAARKGIYTKEMQFVARSEDIGEKELLELMAKGEVIIPANKNHKNLQGKAVGTKMTTKVNANIGISKDCKDIDIEIKKAQYSIDLKADAIMDLSCFGKTRIFRKKLIEISPVMIGTVPIYDAVGFYDKKLKDITVEEFFDVVKVHIKDGVDFLTIHAGLNKQTAKAIKETERLTSIVSRGGSLLYAWMELNNAENPFYEHYDKLLELCQEYDVTLSLGDGCRPGSIADSTDSCQVQETIVLAELTKRAWEKNVQVMIEGPGHMALNEVATNVMLQKKLCYNAPFYVLGPIVTDIAPGYDHITSAIGGAIAAANGADFLCYVTPAEHLRLPSLKDVKEGMVATRLAAHAGDIVKNPKTRKWDNEMSKARADLDWEKMISLSIDPQKAQEYRESSKPEHQDSCSMCGKMCAVRNMGKIKKGEDIQI